MQYTATLSSQYKIVVPKAVRQVLDVGVGENLVFVALLVQVGTLNQVM